MNIFKTFILCFSFVFLCIPAGIIFAETPTTSKAVVVASVDIQDATIISNKDSIISLSFSIKNGQGIQTGVKYSVELVSENKKTISMADRKVYDEILTLAENSVTKKEIIYMAPKTLSGIYTLYIRSGNTRGLPLGITPAGKVTLTSNTKGIEILSTSCTLAVIKSIGISKELPLVIGAFIRPEEKLQVKCLLLNTQNNSLKAKPSFQTTYYDVYGDKVETTGGDTTDIILLPLEKKLVTLILPQSSKPQTYNVNMFFMTDETISNTVSTHYTILGTSASINNASLNKDFYTKGDIAKLSIVWQATTQTSVLSVKALLSDDKGRKCASIVTTPASWKDLNPILDISIPVEKSCFNPHLVLTIKDDKGVVLDQKDFAFKTISATRPPPVSQGIILGILVLSALLIAVLVFINKMKKKHTDAISSK